MDFYKEFNLQVSFSKDSKGDIIIRPTDKDKEKAELYFAKLESSGKSIANVTISYNDFVIKNRSLEKMYRATLKSLAEYLSDIQRRWTPEELHLYFKEKFCRYKKDEGVDLYEKYYRERDGEIVQLERPISFDKKINGKIFKEYVDFYKNHCVSEFNINPFEDLEERDYITRRR